MRLRLRFQSQYGPAPQDSRDPQMAVNDSREKASLLPSAAKFGARVAVMCASLNEPQTHKSSSCTEKEKGSQLFLEVRTSPKFLNILGGQNWRSHVEAGFVRAMGRAIGCSHEPLPTDRPAILECREDNDLDDPAGCRCRTR